MHIKFCLRNHLQRKTIPNFFSFNGNAIFRLYILNMPFGAEIYHKIYYLKIMVLYFFFSCWYFLYKKYSTLLLILTLLCCFDILLGLSYFFLFLIMCCGPLNIANMFAFRDIKRLSMPGLNILNEWNGHISNK